MGKLEVIAYAEDHGNCDAGRKFDLNEATVRGWRKRKEHIQSLPPKKKADRGTNNKYPKLESEQRDWHCYHHSQHSTESQGTGQKQTPHVRGFAKLVPQIHETETAVRQEADRRRPETAHRPQGKARQVPQIHHKNARKTQLSAVIDRTRGTDSFNFRNPRLNESKTKY